MTSLHSKNQSMSQCWRFGWWWWLVGSSLLLSRGSCFAPSTSHQQQFRQPPSSLRITRLSISTSPNDDLFQSSSSLHPRWEESSFSKSLPQERTTTVPGAAILRDFQARGRHYWTTDWTDGCHGTCAAATVFLFFACLAPAVGFGQLYQVTTGGQMAVMESLLASSVAGVVYATTAAQPVTILGGTGPIVAFVACLVQLANTWNVPFLPLYAWTGLWTAGFLALCAVTAASNVVKNLTSFTDEIFSFFISIIFVWEAISDVARSFTAGTEFVISLLTFLCATTTLAVTTACRKAPRSIYGTRRLRTLVHQLAPTIGVAASVGLAQAARCARGLALPTLTLPAIIGSTTAGRPWRVPLGQLPVWARWAAALPACMATVLLFLDHNITVRLVNKYPMKKAKHPDDNSPVGIHSDMLILSVITALLSLIGAPLVEAASVRSIAHCNALTIHDDDDVDNNNNDNNSSSNKNGDQQQQPPRVVGIREQRVTGTAIHLWMAACACLPGPQRTLLSWVAKPSLMGLFLYLGLGTLPGNELWERCLGFFQDRTVAPIPRWGGVRSRVVKAYTALQLACVGALWGVKSNPVLGVAFPLVIAMLSPVRNAMGAFLPQQDLEILDAE